MGIGSWPSRPPQNACSTQLEYLVTDSSIQLPIVNGMEQTKLSYNEARRKRENRVWKKVHLYGRHRWKMSVQRGVTPVDPGEEKS